MSSPHWRCRAESSSPCWPILLIDNYDSFTYNLFQLLGSVTGCPPVVVRNDDVDDMAAIDLTRFGSIVISPGPGRPDVPSDFGICREIVAYADVPLLGVCLGHQGIVVGAGGRVTTAPTPRHGFVSRIRHNGHDLFCGIPSEFAGVRYHSLCAAQPLPDDLDITATAADGVVMAVRHRHRPQWGVQFHPESVCTEFGAELIRNFVQLSQRHRRPGLVVRTESPAAAACSTDPAEPKDPDAVELVVLHESCDTAVDTEAVFDRLYQASSTAFWLDSASICADMGRFSFLGDASGPLAEVVSYRVNQRRVHIRSAAGDHEAPGSVLDYLATQLRRRHAEIPDVPFDFVGGYVGYLGYEMKDDCGGHGPHEAETPDAQWIFADRLIVVDHVAGRTHLVTVVDAATACAGRQWLAATRAVLKGLPAWSPQQPTPPQAEPSAVVARLWRDRRRYLADIGEIAEQLRAGQTYEVNLTNLVCAADRPGAAVYRELRRHNPAPYAAFLRFGELEIACSSPERFLKIDRAATVETKPIKGTVARGSTCEEDENLRRTLQSDPKTRAENLMIVDLLRNDLGRVCQLGSVHVPQLMATETYPTMHHLVSTVRGRLAEGKDVIDCLRACFPGGSMTGAPKTRTLRIIDTLENRARGVYSGTLGLLGLGGTADLNIVIRTAVRYGGRWTIGAGGAIVLGSDAESEFQEMVLKASAVFTAVTGTPSLVR